LNKNKFNFLFTNFEYQPIRELYLTSDLGYKIEEQIGELTQGFSGILSADLQSLNVKDYISNGKLFMMYEKLNPRQIIIMKLILRIQKVFGKIAELW